MEFHPHPTSSIAMLRTTVITVAVAGLLATGAGTAAARPDMPVTRADAALHARAMRAQGAHYAQLGDAAPSSVVRITRAPLADGGFDWADAAIGASLTAALLLSAAGASALRRQHAALR